MRQLLLTVGLLSAAVGTIGQHSCGSKDIGPAPDVRGLPLPEARTTLKRSHYVIAITSHGMFGVIVPQHWVICDQDQPKGQLVHVDVQKYDCHD